jgi:uncharacterized protein YecT (DUF1311 family)
MIKYGIACCLFLGVTLAARAEIPRLLCLDAGNTLDEAKCLNKELAKDTATLADYLTAAQQQIDRQHAGGPRIDASQKTWLNYRDAHCGDVETYWAAGTYRYRAELTCDIEVTRSRIHEVWSAWLWQSGTTLPIRPEP